MKIINMTTLYITSYIHSDFSGHYHVFDSEDKAKDEVKNRITLYLPFIEDFFVKHIAGDILPALKGGASR